MRRVTARPDATLAAGHTYSASSPNVSTAALAARRCDTARCSLCLRNLEGLTAEILEAFAQADGALTALIARYEGRERYQFPGDAAAEIPLTARVP